jgi:regulator of PEP synthase PpsR (kinase-PPPase family)
LSQFDHIEFDRLTLPFVDDPAKADAAVARINAAAGVGDARPLVISSILDPALRARIRTARALVLDVFDHLLPLLEQELGIPSTHAVGRAHGVDTAYRGRIDAVNFALAHDDGLGSHLDQADVVLMGVSRCGKTPTCLYLALQYGLFAANYPLTADDFEREGIPQAVASVRDKLFGLSISPDRLHVIREERRPGSSYAALATCEREVAAAETLFRRLGIPFLDSTNMSIEEIASTIVHQRGLRPRL